MENLKHSSLERKCLENYNFQKSTERRFYKSLIQDIFGICVIKAVLYCQRTFSFPAIQPANCLSFRLFITPAKLPGHSSANLQKVL